MAERGSTGRRHGLRGLLLCCLAAPLCAQERSHDGNLWFEVEVVAFSRNYRPGPGEEITAPDLIDASYLPRTRALADPGSSLMVTFAAPAGTALDTFPLATPPTFSPAPAAPRMGPVYSPAVRDAVVLSDATRDPYVDLTGRGASLAPVLRNLESSGTYRVLWHGAWRQPLLPANQSPAVLVLGGGGYGLHSELEGSLRLRDDSNRAMLDLSLWLNRFTAASVAESGLGADNGDSGIGGAGFGETASRGVGDTQTRSANDETPWRIPAPLQTPEVDASAASAAAGPVGDLPGGNPGVVSPAVTWLLQEVWQMQQTRGLDANQLYYLDHPVLGVLIRISPFTLPLPDSPGEDADF